ncbi:hypothetical protein D3C77_347590 [compost metagenome]
MQALTVFKDRVICPDTREEHPLIEGLSLSKFADIVLRWSNYGDYLLRAHRMALHKSSDYDGSPFEDFYQIRYNVDNCYTISDDPYISITFESTFDSDYDYTAMASRSTTTAYKVGTALKPQETKFKIYRAMLRRREGDAEVWFQHEVLRLQRILDDLDAATTSLNLWAASDINMRVFCPTTGCRSYQSPAIIPPSQLLTYSNAGLSLDNLKERLKCKICGAQCCNIKAA